MLSKWLEIRISLDGYQELCTKKKFLDRYKFNNLSLDIFIIKLLKSKNKWIIINKKKVDGLTFIMSVYKYELLNLCKILSSRVARPIYTVFDAKIFKNILTFSVLGETKIDKQFQHMHGIHFGYCTTIGLY